MFDQAGLYNFEQYNAERIALDAMAMQTWNHKLHKQALAKGIDYADFIQYTLALGPSSTQADTIEKTDNTINHFKRLDIKASYKRQPDTHSKWGKQKSRNTHR